MSVLPPTAAAAQAPTGIVYSGNVACGAGAIIGGAGVAGGYYAIGGGGGAGIGGQQIQFNFNGKISQKITYTVGGKAPPHGEDFDESFDLYISKHEIGDTELGAHYIVWSKLFDDLFSDYGTIVKNQNGMYPAFGSRVTREHFENWLEEITQIFFQKTDIKEHAHPKPHSGDVVGLWIEDRLDRTVDQDWVWIVKNYKHPVIRMDKGWLFQNDTDAIHFKMR